MYLLFFVSRLRVEPRSKTPVIYLRYKAASDACEGVDFNEQLLNAFCFPLGTEAVQPKEVQAPEEYTFTLTHGNGQRYTGFCRQIFPPAPRVGSKARYPQVLCIVAENPWCTFFFKVLQVAEQILKGYEGLLDSAHQELPLDSQLGAFITDLRKQLATNPGAGEVLRVLVPNLHGLSGVSPPRFMGSGTVGDALNWTDDRIELQVPPDCGNGKGNSGIPLARLLFHVPPAGMLSLVASLLLERRIVFVARSRDTVTAAVQAAQALIYPFKWHHIYLPLLPRDLVDYLTAPMPFLVGLPADMLPLIRHIPMSEVTTVDLDLQRVIPPGGGGPGSASDDGRTLPYGRQLCAALEAVFKTVRSPTEYESSPIITGVMQEYFVRLFGSYRRYIHDQATEPLLRPSHSVSAAAGQASWKGGHKDGGGRAGRDGGRAAGGYGADSSASPSGQLGSTSRQHDDMLRGSGYYFDQPSFVAQRRSETVRSFLSAMRHSQLYQMFMMERLDMVASGVIDLATAPASSISQSFSCSSATASGSRPRLIGGSMGLAKSSSANNLSALDRATGQAGAAATSGGGSGGGSGQLSKLSGVQEQHAGGRGGEGGDTHASAAGSGCKLDPFEQRIQRYPEQRRMMRERLRLLVAEAAPAAGGGGGAGGKLASKLRRHRRTDSEDLYSQQHQLQQAQHGVGISFHGGESMRRITTYPGVIDVSLASISEPASYFAEWDLHEDDDDELASPSPSPRDREQMRSWSGNSLQSADSGEVSNHWASGPSSSNGPPAAAAHAASFAFGTRGGGGGPGAGGPGGARDRNPDVGRDGTPMRRLSVPAFAANAKSSYMSLRGMPSVDSPGGDGKTLAQAGVAGQAAGAGGTGGGGGGTRMAAFGSLFTVNSGGIDGATMEMKGGVQVKTTADGHRVYDGSLKDIMRLAATEAKNGLLNSLSNLTSPRNSPKGKDKESAAAAERSARSQQMQAQVQQRQVAASMAAAAAEQHHQAQQLQAGHMHGGPGGNLTPHASFSPLGAGAAAALGAAGTTGQVPLPNMGAPPPYTSVSDGGGPTGGVAGRGPSFSGPPNPGNGRAPAVSVPNASASSSSILHADDPQHRGDRISSFLSGLKDKMAGAGNKALGILPTPAYKPQTTGEKAAKFKAQLTGGGGASLLAGVDGKLKQPHAPQRPLGLSVGSQSSSLAWGADSMGSFVGAPPAPPSTPGWRVPATPTASPAVPGSQPDAGAASSPSRYPRAQSLDLVPGTVRNAGGGGGAADDNGHGTPAPAYHTVPMPSDWDPFGIRSAASASANSASGFVLAGVNGSTTTTASPSPFAAVNLTPQCAPHCAAAVTYSTPGDAGAAIGVGPGTSGNACEASIGDLLGLSPSLMPSVGSSSFGAAAAQASASGGEPFDPFAVPEPAPTPPSRLEAGGSNDYAAFTSAASPNTARDYGPFGQAPVLS